ncbi:hypothetical protein FRC0043_01970 [Corynebacterium belfantii]|nr:hypothetical protein FRC0043_01970 [Corynebacterium belfantii]
MTYDFVMGMDVGKYFHHACVLDPQSRQVLSQHINQHEGSLRKHFGKFLANDAEVLVVVDQPNNIGRLTVTVAQTMGAEVRYLPGLAMRQLSRIHVGNSKTDVRDAYVIAHAGLNLPDALRSVDRVEDVFLQLKVLNGIDEDLARALHTPNQPDAIRTRRNPPRIRTCPAWTDDSPQVDSPPSGEIRWPHQDSTRRQSTAGSLRTWSQSA